MAKVPVYYALEQGVPLPRRRGKTKYQFDQMRLMDSFLVPAKERGTIRSAVARANKALAPERFTSRDVRDRAGKVTGVRVWRVK